MGTYFLLTADDTAIQANTELLEDVETETETLEETEEPEPETVFIYESELVGDANPTEVLQTIDTDDVVVLLEQWQAEQQQYEQKVLEVQAFISDQTRNITSMFFLLVLALGLLSGIVLARTVWRKF